MGPVWMIRNYVIAVHSHGILSRSFTRPPAHIAVLCFHETRNATRLYTDNHYDLYLPQTLAGCCRPIPMMSTISTCSIRPHPAFFHTLRPPPLSHEIVADCATMVQPPFPLAKKLLTLAQTQWLVHPSSRCTLRSILFLVSSLVNNL